MAVVVYFSRKGENFVSGKIEVLAEGNTKVIAKKIGHYLDIPLFEITPIIEYPVQYHETIDRSLKEKKLQSRPKIKKIPYDFTLTDTIFLGYPNWHNSFPMVVASFIETYALADKTIYPFCTHEGSAMGNSVNEIQKLAPDANLKVPLPIRGSRIDRSETAIKHWLCQYKNKKWSECRW